MVQVSIFWLRNWAYSAVSIKATSLHCGRTAKSTLRAIVAFVLWQMNSVKL